MFPTGHADSIWFKTARIRAMVMKQEMQPKGIPWPSISMVPSKTHPQWEALLAGRLDCKFDNTAASMLLCRLQNDLKSDASPAARLRAADELHAFFTKYERMLEAEIRAVFG